MEINLDEMFNRLNALNVLELKRIDIEKLEKLNNLIDDIIKSVTTFNKTWRLREKR